MKGNEKTKGPKIRKTRSICTVAGVDQSCDPALTSPFTHPNRPHTVSSQTSDTAIGNTGVSDYCAAHSQPECLVHGIGCRLSASAPSPISQGRRGLRGEQRLACGMVRHRSAIIWRMQGASSEPRLPMSYMFYAAVLIMSAAAIVYVLLGALRNEVRTAVVSCDVVSRTWSAWFVVAQTFRILRMQGNWQERIGDVTRVELFETRRVELLKTSCVVQMKLSA